MSMDPEVADLMPCAGDCGGLRDRSGQRYCRKCHAAYMRRWRSTHTLTGEQRVKSISRSYAGVYQRRGKLVPQPCEDCGSLEVEKHHPDYSKPLEVVWLCRPCHLARHRGTSPKLICQTDPMSYRLQQRLAQFLGNSVNPLDRSSQGGLLLSLSASHRDREPQMTTSPAVTEVHEPHGYCVTCGIDVHQYAGSGTWEHVVAPHGSPLTRHEPVGKATCCETHKLTATACRDCGQTNPNANVLGSEGCETCGGNLPYKGRASRKHPGHIEISGQGGSFGIPWWVSKNADDAKRAQTTNFLRPAASGHQAGSYDTSQKLHTGTGHTQQAAINDMLSNMAKANGQEWWAR